MTRKYKVVVKKILPGDERTVYSGNEREKALRVYKMYAKEENRGLWEAEYYRNGKLEFWFD